MFNTLKKYLTTLKTRSQKGFTMIELLVVATIMILLTTVGLLSYQKVNQSSRDGKRKADLETVRQALVLYRTDSGTYPVTTNFNSMVSTLNSAGYLSTPTVQDPKNASPYVYSYSSAGSTFTLTATLESTGQSYTLTNP